MFPSGSFITADAGFRSRVEMLLQGPEEIVQYVFLAQRLRSFLQRSHIYRFAVNRTSKFPAAALRHICGLAVTLSLVIMLRAEAALQARYSTRKSLGPQECAASPLARFIRLAQFALSRKTAAPCSRGQSPYLSGHPKISLLRWMKRPALRKANCAICRTASEAMWSHLNS